MNKPVPPTPNPQKLLQNLLAQSGRGQGGILMRGNMLSSPTGQTAGKPRLSEKAFP